MLVIEYQVKQVMLFGNSSLVLVVLVLVLVLVFVLVLVLLFVLVLVLCKPRRGAFLRAETAKGPTDRGGVKSRAPGWVFIDFYRFLSSCLFLVFTGFHRLLTAARPQSKEIEYFTRAASCLALP